MKRILTREVAVGNVKLGGKNPIRVQSMLTSDTMDTNACVEETLRLIKAGCEIVRITAPSKKEAENLRNIKNELLKKNRYVPLVADIHYTPNAAEIAAEIVEKVRINPGNYSDKKLFKFKEYTEEEYRNALEKIEKKLVPLLEKCKQRNVALRIGVNHGSLSDRIMSVYGDTPEGMVQSALEFIEIAEKHNFFDIVLSMKSSNPRVMVYAYRLLMQKQIQRGKVYPLHLGVTEAGDGIPGRVKSALGIGTLLAEGLGDTIRVSLTEPAENEIPVAKFLAQIFNFQKIYQTPSENKIPNPTFDYEPRKTHIYENTYFNGKNPPAVFLKIREQAQLDQAGFKFDFHRKEWVATDISADFVFYDFPTLCYEAPTSYRGNKELKFVTFSPQTSPENFSKEQKIVAVYTLQNPWEIQAIKEHLQTHSFPSVLRVISSENFSEEKASVWFAALAGPFLIDGLVQGIFLENPHLSVKFLRELSFEILQASNERIVKADFVSCPSCGRTLFDLAETTARIKEKTKHLKGLKIAIMGCIVNGPGEMADADYGYVGAGKDRISLYRGKELIRKNVKTADALNELINLIKEDGRWIEPEKISL